MLILFGIILIPNPSLRTTRKTRPLPQRDDGQRRLICAAGARGRRHWCAATRARSRHDRGGVRGRLTRCRRSRRRSAARTDSRPTAVDKRVLSSTARDTVITFVVLEHHVVACTSPPSGRTSNRRSLRCRRTVDVNQYTVRASPRGFGALGGQRRAALVGLSRDSTGDAAGGCARVLAHFLYTIHLTTGALVMRTRGSLRTAVVTAYNSDQNYRLPEASHL